MTNVLFLLSQFNQMFLDLGYGWLAESTKTAPRTDACCNL